MDLVKIYEDNKQKEKEAKELKESLELETATKKLIADIIMGKDQYYTNCERLLKEIGLKYEETKTACNFGFSFGLYNYATKLNKSNIKKIQKYIDEKEVETL